MCGDGTRAPAFVRGVVQQLAPKTRAAKKRQGCCRPCSARRGAHPGGSCSSSWPPPSSSGRGPPATNDEGSRVRRQRAVKPRAWSQAASRGMHQKAQMARQTHSPGRGCSGPHKQALSLPREQAPPQAPGAARCGAHRRAARHHSRHAAQLLLAHCLHHGGRLSTHGKGSGERVSLGGMGAAWHGRARQPAGRGAQPRRPVRSTAQMLARPAASRGRLTRCY